MIANRLIPTANQQRGAATLLISLILLVAMTITALTISRSSIIELKTSSNAYRANQALEAADSGLNFMIGYYVNGGADHDGDGVVDTFDPADTDGDGNANTRLIDGKVVEARFCTVDSTPPTTCTAPTTDFNNVMVYARGWSDDRMAVHYIRQLTVFVQALPNGPTNPFIARTAASMKATGNLTIKNNETNNTIWIGDDISTANGSFNTYIQIDGVNDQKSSEKSGSTYTLGPDVIHNDLNLKNSTTTEFFENFFGVSKAEVMASATTVVDAGAGGTLSSGTHDNELIYITNASAGFSIGQDLGSYDSATGTYNPVILVVDGPLTIVGNTTIYGVVYTTDLKKAAGTANVVGSMICEDVEDATGGFTIEYNGAVMSSVEKIGKHALISNSWRDW